MQEDNQTADYYIMLTLDKEAKENSLQNSALGSC